MTRRNIILKPILTEKISRLEEIERKYCFQVEKEANKIEIQHAIEKRFDVEVSNVVTMNYKGKSKQMTVRSGGRSIRTTGRRANWKKAMVTLKEGFRIDLVEAEG